MNRQEKETVIAELKKDFSNSIGLFLIGYRGMTVDQLQRLSKILCAKSGAIKSC